MEESELNFAFDLVRPYVEATETETVGVEVVAASNEEALSIRGSVKTNTIRKSGYRAHLPIIFTIVIIFMILF